MLVPLAKAIFILSRSHKAIFTRPSEIAPVHFKTCASETQPRTSYIVWQLVGRVVVEGAVGDDIMLPQRLTRFLDLRRYQRLKLRRLRSASKHESPLRCAIMIT
jgi:hypothetical protein